MSVALNRVQGCAPAQLPPQTGLVGSPSPQRPGAFRVGVSWPRWAPVGASGPCGIAAAAVLEPPEALVGLGPFPVFVRRHVMPVGGAAPLPGVFIQLLSTRHRSEARRPWDQLLVAGGGQPCTSRGASGVSSASSLGPWFVKDDDAS